MNDNDVVKNYLQAVENLISSGESKKFWLFAPGQVDSYFIDIFSIDLFEKFKNDEEKFKSALSKLETNIIRWFALPSVILGLKLANKYENYHATPQEMVDYIKAIEGVLNQKVFSDPFCLDGQNKKMSDHEARNKQQVTYLFQPEQRKIINTFSTILQSYLWSIEFDAFTYGASWHGPYLVDSKKLLIKSYFDLRPSVWDLPDLPTSVDVFYSFQENIDWKVNIMELATYQPDIWENLNSLGLTIDNKSVDNLEEVQDLSNRFSNVRDQQVELVEKLSPQEIIKRGMEVYYYMFREFFTYYHEDSKPPQKCYQRIKDEGLKHWNSFKQDKSQERTPGKDYFKNLYDPRTNFTG